MAHYPKLKVTGIGWEQEGEIWDFEQGKYFRYDDRNMIITAEKRIIRSFDDLIELAGREENKAKDMLNIVFLPVIVGG